MHMKVLVVLKELNDHKFIATTRGNCFDGLSKKISQDDFPPRRTSVVLLMTM